MSLHFQTFGRSGLFLEPVEGRLQLHTKVLFGTLICVLVLGINGGYGQDPNMLSNGGFEEFEKEPTVWGQIDVANNWDDVIRTSDYMNTSYSGWQGDLDGAKSGTGYAGFAQYDNTRAAEAIGQRIGNNPLEGGQTYQISLYAKGVADGLFSEKCAGIAVYGFNKPWVATEWHNRHARELLGATLLWKSETIDTSKWTRLGGCFKPRVDMSYIVITNEYVPGCQQYTYVDDVYIVPYQTDLYEEGQDTTECACLVYVPEVFSPNADGTNDSFRTVSKCEIDAYELSVYNRWGERVFCSESHLEAWDGSFNGLEAPKGIYLYMLRYRRSDGVVMESDGSVMIIR